MRNAVRHWDTGKLDRQYLRTCACYKLVKAGKIGLDRAVELMNAVKVKNARATVETWSRK